MEHDTQASSAWERQAIEKLLHAQLRESRAARRWKIFRSLVWMLLFAALIWTLMTRGFSGHETGELQREHTAVIELRGLIAPHAEASAENIFPAMRKALESPSSQALVLLIDSPGGSPVQAGMINDEIRRLRSLYDKPIYAVVEETCASAAYYIASAADDIYVDKASVVGSIGVLMNGFGFVDAMEKMGIERRLLTAGENKGMLDPFSPLTAEQKQFAQGMLDDIHEQFIAVVKAGRGDRLKHAPELFSGLFWTGSQAVELGLADDLGNVQQVAREVVGAEKIVDYTYVGSLPERLAKRLGLAAGQALLKSLQSPGLMR